MAEANTAQCGLEFSRREDFQLEPADTTRLITQAIAGDDASWCAIVAEYAPRVHALLVSNCHDHDLAEEITQSTFCTVAAKLPSYVDQGKFSSWLFRIAMNRLRDEMRRRKRQAIPVAAEVLRPVSRTGREDRSHHEKIDSDMAGALWAAVRGLAEADQLHVNDVWIDRLAVLITQTEARHRGRPHRAHNGVDAFRQFQICFSARLTF